jgi:hypothetical protein
LLKVERLLGRGLKDAVPDQTHLLGLLIIMGSDDRGAVVLVAGIDADVDRQ